jgi:hypothetical protein
MEEAEYRVEMQNRLHPGREQERLREAEANREIPEELVSENEGISEPEN